MHCLQRIFNFQMTIVILVDSYYNRLIDCVRFSVLVGHNSVLMCYGLLFSGTYEVELVNDSLYEWNVKLNK